MQLCGQEHPGVRDQFLHLTIHEFGRLGPGRFSPVTLTRDLGYTTAMINHYFGSRRGLIAEAAFEVYQQYLSQMRNGVAEAESTPVARLRAWMSAQIAFAFALPGWAVVLNYPNLSLEDPVEFDEKFRDRMTAGFELNMGRLAQLILDVESGNVAAEEVTAENFDRAGYLANQRLVELTASVAMSTLGAAVWGAGSHAPSRDTEEAQRLRGYVINQHIEHVIASL
jgi:AcrR family transcriptional regulator